MSHAASGAPGIPALAHDNVNLPEGSAEGLSRTLLFVGAIGLFGTIAGWFVDPKHAMASFLMGTATVLAICLGSLFWVMVSHLTNSGWTGTIRRQLENAMSLMWLPVSMIVVFVVVELISGGKLFTWLHPDPNDVLLAWKRPVLNPYSLVLIVVVVSAVWIGLSMLLWGWSKRQDETHDRRYAAKSRWLSSFGMLLFALSTSLGAILLLMSLDPTFFSTMWGVYYFAGCTCSGLATLILVLAGLRFAGRLTGAVTQEHNHDLGKLLFGFTVFWAYISFSQYFLIWYGNIPEETAYYLFRTTTPAWKPVALFLGVGHFILPFLFLLPRTVKRNTGLLAIGAAWLLLMQVVDMFFVIRPMAGVGVGDGEPSLGVGMLWVDIAAVVGCLGLFGGLLVKKIGSGPLVPEFDPRMDEAIHHKNYV